MGLYLHWASRSGKLASNNPLVKGPLPLFFSKIKLPLSVKVNSLWSETIVAVVSLCQISHSQQAVTFASLRTLLKISQGRNFRAINVWLESNWGATEYYLTAQHELMLSLFLPLTQVQGPSVCMCWRLWNLQRGLTILAAISSQLPDSAL